MCREKIQMILSVAAITFLATPAFAQQTSNATATKAFEVIAVEGNRLVVRLPEGTREISVPDGFQFTVDGRQLAVNELKPGMKGTATITTRTTVTPVSVTEVKNGRVMQASGGSILVRTDEGFRMFTQGDVDKRGVKIIRSGQPATIADFREGDMLTATIVTSKPPRVVSEQEVKATLAKAPPAPAAAATSGASSNPPAARPASTPAAPAPATAAPARAAAAPPKKLPKTASALPLIGLLGLVSLAGGALLTARRGLAR